MLIVTWQSKVVTNLACQNHFICEVPWSKAQENMLVYKNLHFRVIWRFLSVLNKIHKRSDDDSNNLQSTHHVPGKSYTFKNFN